MRVKIKLRTRLTKIIIIRIKIKEIRITTFDEFLKNSNKNLLFFKITNTKM